MADTASTTAYVLLSTDNLRPNIGRCHGISL